MKFILFSLAVFGVVLLVSCVTDEKSEPKTVEEVLSICSSNSNVECGACEYELLRFYDKIGDVIREECLQGDVSCGELGTPHCFLPLPDSSEVVLQRIYCDGYASNECSVVGD